MTRLVGNRAPDFKAPAVVNGKFKDISLSDFDGKWKVLLFYPLDFTFVCPTEITAYNDAAPRFRELSCEVMAISTDSQFSHLAWVEQPRNDGGLGKETTMPLIADFNKTIARDYEVLIEDEGVALRGLFLIDTKNNIQHSTINNLPVGRNVEETLRLLEAYQFTEKHGEVCPANWNKGSDTMKPDPVGSKEYFKKAK
ncbi:MAG: peroxiredoxin [Bacteriovoracales bacterium]|nr:peroxiredoxin [Bacteriovoracales bacterium]